MRLSSILLAITVVAPFCASAEKNKGGDPARTVVVARVSVPGNFGVSRGIADKIQADLVAELSGTGKFADVWREGGEIRDQPTRGLLLTSTITSYKPGNQAMRYIVGFGAGKTQIKAFVRFVDMQSGELVLEKEVDGKVIMGMYGGDSAGATRGLAKEVAKLAKKRL